MTTFLQFILLIIGGLVVLSGCASANLSPVEQSTSPTVTPVQMTQPEGEVQQAQSSDTDRFIFYDSYADW